MTGFVYAMQSADGLVKIGFTANPARRIQTLRTGNGRHIRPRGCLPATLEQEKQLHRLLANSRERAEWYRPTRDVLHVLSRMHPWQPPIGERQGPRCKVGCTAFGDWLVANDMTGTEAAKYLGVRQSTVSRIANGLCIPKVGVALKIEALTQGVVPAISFARPA